MLNQKHHDATSLEEVDSQPNHIGQDIISDNLGWSIQKAKEKGSNYNCIGKYKAKLVLYKLALY